MIDSQTPRLPHEWEAWWSPYDPPTYQAALAYLDAGMTVLDIGAGDLRFARQAAAKGCQVIAIERRSDVLRRGLSGALLPEGLRVVQTDAREWGFPSDLDAAVLLMRHCAQYPLYVTKLRAVGCPVLITNARWRLGVERVSLLRAASYDRVQIGWYACVRCGQVGFVPGDPAKLTGVLEQDYLNVEECPDCTQAGKKASTTTARACPAGCGILPGEKLGEVSRKAVA